MRNNKLSSWPHSAETAPVDWAEVGRPERERRKIRIVSPEEKEEHLKKICPYSDVCMPALNSTEICYKHQILICAVPPSHQVS